MNPRPIRSFHTAEDSLGFLTQSPYIGDFRMDSSPEIAPRFEAR